MSGPRCKGGEESCCRWWGCDFCRRLESLSVELTCVVSKLSTSSVESVEVPVTGCAGQ